MRTLLIACSFPLLAACTHMGQKVDAQKQVRLVTYASVAEVDSACRKAGYAALPYPLAVIEGCAVWTENACTILARSPEHGSDVGAFRVLGHETMHCFTGDWHDDMQRTGVDLLPGGASAASLLRGAGAR